MLKYEDLTVGIVAGIIAAGVFVIQFIVPTLLILVLVGVLKNENNAATWSVIGRSLHASHWPAILRTDSAGVQGVRGSVRLITVLEILLLLLVSIASIVTPLGLYETVIAREDLQEQPFQYARDNSSMSNGTLPRNNDFGPSRSCMGSFRPVACPWTDTVIIEESNSTTYTADLPDGYDVRIPRNITEIYSAGLSKFQNTVSSVFDIQWRTYQKVVQTKFMRNGQQYLVGDYRHLTQMVMNDAWEAVAGLIVNTKTGGIGFRNHTTPPLLPFGSAWSEDLLFIEPETECVDMNITMDFNIPLSNDVFEEVENLTVTDHGGFANLNKEVAWYDQNKTWANANLRDRAYFAAWFSNVYTMFYLNITNPKDKVFPDRFHYINSKVGDKFPIDAKGSNFGAFKARYDMLVLKSGYGDFMNMPNLNLNGTIFNGTIYPNPFKISKDNFTDIPPACANVNDNYRANISNIAISCGMMYGAARRKDGSASILFDPGSEWTVPLYSCATASKASIKTVSFRYNGTDGLKSLEVVDIKPKEYAKEEDMPLWGVENLSLRLENGNPVWGITLPEHANHPNITTARQPYLYLPGFADPENVRPVKQSQNFAGVDFYPSVMSTTYNIDQNVDPGSRISIPDYTGRTNLALYAKWQEYSRDTTMAARVINLIWTDLSANAVVGTKSHLPSQPLQNLGKREEGVTTVKVPVTVYTRRVRFKLLYGVPAFLVLALAALIFIIAFFMVVSGRSTPARIRRYLNQTSAGRIFTAFLYPNDCPPGSSRSNWVRSVGRKRIDVDGRFPRGTDAASGTVLSAPGATTGDIPYGKLDSGAISMHSLPSPQPYSPVNAGGGAAQSYYNEAGDITNNSTYTYVPPGSGAVYPNGAGYTEFRSGKTSPGNVKSN